MTTQRERGQLDAGSPEQGSGTPGASSTGGRGGRKGKGYFLPGIIALIALLGIGLFFVGAGDLQHRPATELAGSDISSQIALAIQAQTNSGSVPTVTCPQHEPVRQGTRFSCTLHGRPDRIVYVTEVDGRGRIRWSFSPG